MKTFWALILLTMTTPAMAKSERTYYTDAKVARMRQNIARYDWARKQRDEILTAAERWTAWSDEKLRALVIPPQVPRAYDIHNFGCPVHGVAANRDGFYKWGIDPERPFKIRCPAGGEEYPSNDFARFLASGMTDRSLLTGEYADDGWGWKKPGETQGYWFIAYYAHWSMRNFLMPAIRDLATAAVVAEEGEPARRYAHQAALLLWQLATYYPEYAYEKQSREAREHNPNYTGKLTNMIWEVETPQICAPAYDAIWPFLRADRALQATTGLDGAGLDAFLRERLLGEAARAIMDGSGRIRGNYGMHQSALVLLAAALDERQRSPTSAEMTRWVLANPTPKVDTDMGIVDALANLVFRDGMPSESPGYNYHWVTTLVQAARPLAEMGIDVFAQPRFRKLLSWPFDLVVAGQFVPPLGDTGDLYARAQTLSPAVCAAVLPYVRDARLAAVLRAQPEAGRDLFSQPAEEMLAEIPAAPAAPAGASHHFPAYGLATLQAGSGKDPAALSLFYGSWTNHMHHDQLNLLLFAHGHPLLCDVGYPEQTDAFNHKRYGFWNNTVAHNTVVVDAVKQGRGPGRLHAYSPHGFAQVVDAACEGAYPDLVSRYRRASVQVTASPGHSYVFDVFYVRGGRQHDFVCMGPPATFTCEPALGPPQSMGTLAGPDVPYEQFYDDPTLKDKPLGSVSYAGYRGSGFQFLTNVQRAPLHQPAVADWRLTPPPGAEPAPAPGPPTGLRAHLVGNDEELLACDGKPQGYRHLPPSIKFLLRRRQGQALESRFVTVFEPYHGEPWIRRVTSLRVAPADGEAVAAQVELLDGTRHLLFHSLNPGRRYTVDGRLSVDGQAACLVLDRAGKPVRAMLLNGTRLAMGSFALQGRGLRKSRITAVDYERGIIELADPMLDDRLRPDTTVHVAPEGFAESVTLRRVLDARRFSIGDEDLRVGGGTVTGVTAASNRLLTGVASPLARTGMTVLNNRWEVQGRLAAGERWMLERSGRGPLREEDFPAAADGSGRRFAIVMAAPGDVVWIPDLAETEP